MKIESGLNLWRYSEYYKWYRIPKHIKLFFKKIYWMFQRSIYGYCERDVWNLDYSLGMYLTNTLTRLADISHGHPGKYTEEEWDTALRTAANDFLLGVDEDSWVNPYEDMVVHTHWNYMESEQKEVWKKYIEKEKEKSAEMTKHLMRGCDFLKENFYDLWD